MDALADVLKAIRLNANTYFCSDFHTSWGMSIPDSPEGKFHVVLEGECWLQSVTNERPLHLQCGDIVALPTGGEHWIGDKPNSQRLSGADVVNAIATGDNPFSSPDHQAPIRNTLMCGSFSYDSSMDHPFLKDLPCIIHIQAQHTPELAWLRTIATVLSVESRQSSQGSTVMIDRLTEILFIQLIRQHMKVSTEKIGYMAALANRQIGQALNLIHAEKEAEWTVKKLGEAVSLSRTAFTEKFTRLVGIPPKTYLLKWRLQKAKELLQNGKSPMYAIAELSGYSSESAFSKAFKELYSVTPGQARKSSAGTQKAN